ncbi:tyrosine-type recombinase/integrase [Streptosporangiaceae bacterium NEAU-GS5]|nr:tyrosine-type recombinase/integrase [Streptosporangiaceae bacterium NEAU-GS5]
MPGLVASAVTRQVERFQLAPDAVLGQTGHGTLLRRDYFNKKVWKPAVARVGLPCDVTFHYLRHAFASTALAEGVPMSEVSRWLGHKSITTTVDLYGHLVP